MGKFNLTSSAPFVLAAATMASSCSLDNRYTCGAPEVEPVMVTALMQAELAEAFGIVGNLSLAEGAGPGMVNGSVTLQNGEDLAVRFARDAQGGFYNTMMLGKAAVTSGRQEITRAIIGECCKGNQIEPKYIGTNPDSNDLLVVLGPKDSAGLEAGDSLKGFTVCELLTDGNGGVKSITHETRGYLDDPIVYQHDVVSDRVPMLRINFLLSEDRANSLSIPVDPRHSSLPVSYEWSQHVDGSVNLSSTPPRIEYLIAAGDVAQLYRMAGVAVTDFGDPTQLNQMVIGGLRR